MLENISIELISTIGATLFGLITFLWKKVVKPIIKILSDQEVILVHINEIKHELSTNNGSSLKDTVNSLKTTCEIIDQRIKSTLDYNNKALFETDKDGNLIWVNQKFYDLTGENPEDIKGKNWYNYICTKDRERFINEFSSCSKTSRKFEFETKSHNGKLIKLTGIPYKINNSEHNGFLFNISIQGGVYR